MNIFYSFKVFQVCIFLAFSGVSTACAHLGRIGLEDEGVVTGSPFIGPGVPNFRNAPYMEPPMSTSFSVGLSAWGAGEVYSVRLPDNALAPSPRQIEQGQDLAGNTMRTDSAKQLKLGLCTEPDYLATLTYNFPNPSDHSYDYDVYVVLKAGGLYSPIKKLDVLYSPKGSLPTFDREPALSGMPGALSFDIHLSSDMPAIVYSVRIASGSPTPSTMQIENGQDACGKDAPSAIADIAAGDASSYDQTLAYSISNTTNDPYSYDVYVLLKSGELYSKVRKVLVAYRPSPSDTPPADPLPSDTPPADTPPADTPPADPLPSDTPPADTPPADPLPSDTPPADTPPADTPPADTPPADTPPSDTPPADPLPSDTPPADTPPADTPPADPPPADTPPADTPPADTPPADTPPADTPPADTPPADTPPADPPSPATPSFDAGPVLTGFPNSANFVIFLSSNMPAAVYSVRVARGAASPSAAQIENAQDANGNSAASNNGNITSSDGPGYSETLRYSISNPTNAPYSYDVYVVLKSGTFYSTVAKAAVDYTSAPNFDSGPAFHGFPSHSSFAIRLSGDRPVTAYSVRLARGAASPSAAQIENAQDANGLFVPNITTTATYGPSYDQTLTYSVSNAANNAYSYDIYIVLKAWGLYSAVEKIAIDYTPTLNFHAEPAASGSPASERFTISFSADRAFAMRSVRVARGAPMPSIEQIENGQNANGQSVPNGSAIIPPGSTGPYILTSTYGISNPANNAYSYDIYVVLKSENFYSDVIRVPVDYSP